MKAYPLKGCEYVILINVSVALYAQSILLRFKYFLPSHVKVWIKNLYVFLMHIQLLSVLINSDQVYYRHMFNTILLCYSYLNCFMFDKLMLMTLCKHFGILSVCQTLNYNYARKTNSSCTWSSGKNYFQHIICK